MNPGGPAEPRELETADGRADFDGGASVDSALAGAEGRRGTRRGLCAVSESLAQGLASPGRPRLELESSLAGAQSQAGTQETPPPRLLERRGIMQVLFPAGPCDTALH